jgi:uncharacterized BrkB/YihY/UPF0761 family membrane protein
VNPTMKPNEPADQLRVTWRGKDVVNPAARWFVVAFSVLFMMALVLVLTALSPLLVILQFILRALGRRGFVLYYPDGTYKVDVSTSAFEGLHE